MQPLAPRRGEPRRRESGRGGSRSDPRHALDGPSWTRWGGPHRKEPALDVAEAVAKFTARVYTGHCRAAEHGLCEVLAGRACGPEALQIDDLVRLTREGDPGARAPVFILSHRETGSCRTDVVPVGAGRDDLDLETVQRLRGARLGGGPAAGETF